MQVDTQAWAAFAGLVAYPGGNALRIREEWAPVVVRRWPEVAPQVEALVEFLQRSGEGECEELFTRTFDGNAERALELGWHLHGENYARGVLLVRLRELLRRNGLEECGELPDHVANVLRLLSCVDTETARALIRQVLVPGVERVVEGFGGPPPVDAAADANPYRGTLSALHSVLEREANLTRSEP